MGYDATEFYIACNPPLLPDGVELIVRESIKALGRDLCEILYEPHIPWFKCISFVENRTRVVDTIQRLLTTHLENETDLADPTADTNGDIEIIPQVPHFLPWRAFVEASTADSACEHYTLPYIVRDMPGRAVWKSLESHPGMTPMKIFTTLLHRWGEDPMLPKTLEQFAGFLGCKIAQNLKETVVYIGSEDELHGPEIVKNITMKLDRLLEFAVTLPSRHHHVVHIEGADDSRLSYQCLSHHGLAQSTYLRTELAPPTRDAYERLMTAAGLRSYVKTRSGRWVPDSTAYPVNPLTKDDVAQPFKAFEEFKFRERNTADTIVNASATVSVVSPTAKDQFHSSIRDDIIAWRETVNGASKSGRSNKDDIDHAFASKGQDNECLEHAVFESPAVVESDMDEQTRQFLQSDDLIMLNSRPQTPTSPLPAVNLLDDQSPVTQHFEHHPPLKCQPCEADSQDIADLMGSLGSLGTGDGETASKPTIEGETRNLMQMSSSHRSYSPMKRKLGLSSVEQSPQQIPCQTSLPAGWPAGMTFAKITAPKSEVTQAVANSPKGDRTKWAPRLLGTPTLSSLEAGETSMTLNPARSTVLAEMEGKLCEMTKVLEMSPGDVELKVHFGRLYLKDLQTSLINVGSGPSWSIKNIRAQLDDRMFSQQHVVFQTILSARGADGDDLANIPPAANSSWQAAQRETWYHFLCRAKKQERGDSFFVLEVNADSFHYKCRSSKDELSALYVHCTRRAWDLKVSVTRSSKAKLPLGCEEFAEAFISSMIVASRSKSKLTIEAMERSRSGITIESARVRHTATYHNMEQGGAALNVTLNQNLKITRSSKSRSKSADWGEISLHLQKPCYTGDRPSQWLEASVTATRADEAFKGNTVLDFGDRAEWNSDQLRSDGVFEGLCAPCLEMVSRMDRIGAGNDNSQGPAVKNSFSDSVAESNARKGGYEFW